MGESIRSVNCDDNPLGNHPLAAQSSLAAQTYLLRHVDLKLETVSAQCMFHIYFTQALDHV